MSTLLNKKSSITTIEQLRELPFPESRGSRHEPVPHYLLVDSLEVEAMSRGYSVKRSQLSINAAGTKLFGVMDLIPPGVVDVTERGMSIGFRNSTNSSLSIKMVAGNRVMVCDNLAMLGDLIAVLQKNLGGLDLDAVLAEGFDKFLQHASTLDLHIMRMQATNITDIAAKAKIFDVFANRVLPVNLFDDVRGFYFNPSDEMLDCQPRTEWGLHNAFTRAMKGLAPATFFAANVELGRNFGMTSANAI